MWTTTTKSVHEHDFDKVVEMIHDFGNGVTVVTSFQTNTTTLMHGAIAVNEHPLISDTEKYANFLTNLNNEVNPIKN